ELPHDYGSGSYFVFDRNCRSDSGFSHGAHAIRGQALAADPRRPFAGVRTREVDYNSRTGALLFGGANGAPHSGGFDQGRGADGFAVGPDHVAAGSWNRVGPCAARGRGGLSGWFELETFLGHRGPGSRDGAGGLSFS